MVRSRASARWILVNFRNSWIRPLSIWLEPWLTWSSEDMIDFDLECEAVLVGR